MTKLISALALAFSILQTTPVFALTTYGDCRSLLSCIEVPSAAERERLASIRDEYAEVAAQLRKVVAHNARNACAIRRAAGDDGLDTVKRRRSIGLKARLAMAGFPVLFQLPTLIRATKMAAFRDLFLGEMPERDRDEATVREALADLERAGRFFAEAADRAEAIAIEAAAKLGAE